MTASRVVVDRDVPVAMRDGVTLRGDLYRPADGGPFPVLIERTPYSKDLPVGLMVVLNPLRAAADGYAVFVQDVRGRFTSEGAFVPFVNEALDGFDTVEWAAAQPWSTGRVGMFGSSYMAATQLQAATVAPPHLRAICPIGGSSDYYEGRSYRGGAFELGGLLCIALFALAAGSIQRAGPSPDVVRDNWREVKAMLDRLPEVAATAPLSDLRHTALGTWAPFFFDWLEHDQPGAYWDAFSVERYHHRITVPGLHISSWYDQYAVGAIANYVGISANAATAEARDGQCLWLGPWGHYMPRTALNGAARLGEIDFGLDALVDLDRVQLAWFDRWLKDDPTSWRFPTPVRLFTIGANRWSNATQWPVPATVAELYLDAGRLQSAPPGAHSEPDRFVADPADPTPTIGGPHLMLDSAFPQGPLDQSPAEARHDVVTFTSDVLDDDLEVTGAVALEVWVASSAPSIDVVATLTVVRPDGRSILVVDGVRRVALGSSEPIHVEVALGAISQRFERGARIRLRLAGASFPRFDLNPHTGEHPSAARTRAAAERTVYHDAAHPSVLRLPVTHGRVPRVP